MRFYRDVSSASDDDRIFCCTERPADWSEEQARAVGWDGPGWYFREDGEVEAHYHGPFATREEAARACRGNASALT